MDMRTFWIGTLVPSALWGAVVALLEMNIFWAIFPIILYSVFWKLLWELEHKEKS